MTKWIESRCENSENKRWAESKHNKMREKIINVRILLVFFRVCSMLKQIVFFFPVNEVNIYIYLIHHMVQLK